MDDEVSDKEKAVPSQTVYLSSVVSFHGKLYMLKIYVNSEASWTNFLIENGKKVTFREQFLQLLWVLKILSSLQYLGWGEDHAKPQKNGTHVTCQDAQCY